MRSFGVVVDQPFGPVVVDPVAVESGQVGEQQLFVVVHAVLLYGAVETLAIGVYFGATRVSMAPTTVSDTQEQSMSIPILQIDAFAEQPFQGNPAAVCILAEPKAESWMQSVAAEMNLAETAFLVKRTDGYDLRWFTPKMEVDLCGHATLASSYTLWSEGYLEKTETARFHTKSGLLTCTLREDGRIGMDFPARLSDAVDPPAGLLDALGIEGYVYVGRNADDYLIAVDSPEIVYDLTPDFGQLAQVDTRGSVVTSQATDSDEYDFVSRVFAPACGINEDPVTGAAHCALTPYWAGKLGKARMVGYQASSRGGVVRVELNGERVLLSGHAVTVLKGALHA